MKRTTILDIRTERAMKHDGGGWIMGPYTNGQASFHKVSNSRKAIERTGIDMTENDVLIVIGAKRQHTYMGTKNRILYRPKQGEKATRGLYF